MRGVCEALLLFVSVVYPYNESMNSLLDLYSNELNARVYEDLRLRTVV